MGGPVTRVSSQVELPRNSAVRGNQCHQMVITGAIPIVDKYHNRWLIRALLKESGKNLNPVQGNLIDLHGE